VTPLRIAAVAALAAVAGCASSGDDDLGADRPAATPAPSAGATGVEPVGFTTVTARVTAVDGELCDVCVWLADTSDEQARGLMGVTDLGDPVGMAFRFEEPQDPGVDSFYMRDTPTPLSIAWFGPEGAYVGQADMEPCLDAPAGECPLYSPGVAYDLALEVFRGDLDTLGIGPGARLELLDGTEAATCAT
jgi:hypothetical protein